MRCIVFEDSGVRDLYPLALSRAVFELRVGVDTLLDKIESALRCRATEFIARSEISGVVRERLARDAAQAASECVVVNGRAMFCGAAALPADTAWFDGDVLVAARVSSPIAATLTHDVLSSPQRTRVALSSVRIAPIPSDVVRMIRFPWDLIAANGAELSRQVGLMPAVSDGAVHAGAYLLNPSAIRIGAGAKIRPTAVLDAEDGPIHIGRNVTISPGVSIKGPCSIGDGSLIQPGANIRENTSIGPVCKVGGEVEGTIVQGYSNKQHDGFLGHSYIGEWVNLGADTVTSDLKNTYGNVSVPLHGTPIDSGQRFVGSIIGDHCKTGICTALTTGTVIGFCCNVVASRPPQFVPSFTWLTPDGSKQFDLERAISIARTVMSRRKVTMSAAVEAMFRGIAISSQQSAVSGQQSATNGHSPENTSTAGPVLKM